LSPPIILENSNEIEKKNVLHKFLHCIIQVIYTFRWPNLILFTSRSFEEEKMVYLNEGKMSSDEIMVSPCSEVPMI
jgi:hypothetical protein